MEILINPKHKRLSISPCTFHKIFFLNELGEVRPEFQLSSYSNTAANRIQIELCFDRKIKKLMHISKIA